jgi:hypothetical protein
MLIFDSNKNAGLALMIVGIMSLSLPLIFLIAIISDPSIWSEVKGMFIICAFSTLAGALELWDGVMIYRSHSEKREIICEYITISALIILIDVFSSALFAVVEKEELDEELITIILSLIATVLSLLMVRSLNKRSGSFLDSIIWCVIVISFTASVLLNISDFIDSAFELDPFGIIEEICFFIVYGFVLAGMFTKEIMTSMGIMRLFNKDMDRIT